MRYVPAVLATASLLGGCANWNSIHHDFKPDNGDSMSIDAKQRVVFSVTKDYGGEKTWKAFCAEPSPDALAAVSASLGLDAAVGAKALGAAFASSESAASIGLRTQSITILRDGMYRLCEGYASGALDDIGFQRLQRRYQAIMLGLLAIEQLTGATVAKQAVLTGSAGAKLGQSLSQITALIAATRSRSENAKAELDARTTDLATKKTALDGADKDVKAEIKANGADTPKATELKAKQKTASDAVLAAEAAKQQATIAASIEAAELANLESLRKDLDRAAAIAATAGSLVDVSSAAKGPISDAAIAEVAKAVTTIVTTIVEHDYSREACMDMITSRHAGASSELDKVEVLKLRVNFCLLAMEISTIKATTKSGGRTPALTDAESKSIAESVKTFRVELDKIGQPSKLDKAVQEGRSSADTAQKAAQFAVDAARSADRSADLADRAASLAAAAAAKK